MSENNTNNTEGGNTETPSYRPKSMRRLCFTLNNYSNTEIQVLEQLISQTSRYKIIFGYEVGENGTPHIQGYIESANGRPKNFSVWKNVLGDRCHIEKARGNRQQNIEYCSKDGNFMSSFPKTMKELVMVDYLNVSWKPWQQEIVDLYETEPDKRKIHWIVDETGNSGKSFLARWLVLTKSVLLAGGKKADVFYQVQKRLEKEDADPFRMVVLDIPRHQQDFTNYGVLENLKDGLILSTKYEGGTFVFPVPHVVVFSNAAPDMSKFSMDRWVVNFL